MRCTALEMVAVARIAKRARRGDTNADIGTKVTWRRPTLTSAPI